MMAIVAIHKKQYIVSPGDVISIPHYKGEVGDVLTFDEVLLVSDDKKTDVGTPFVAKRFVEAKIIAQKKGEKVDVRRYKSKVRYRKHHGFRPVLTDLSIVKIG